MKKILSIILLFSILIICPVVAFADNEILTEDTSLYEDITYIEEESFSILPETFSGETESFFADISELFSNIANFEVPEGLYKMSAVCQIIIFILAIFVIFFIVRKMYINSNLKQKIDSYLTKRKQQKEQAQNENADENDSK